jgi:hypothetical protein
VEGLTMPEIAATYQYKDATGSLLFEVVRYKPKGFAQRRPDGNGGWIRNLKGVATTLYRLSELAGHEAIWITEGERDADRLWGMGLGATTCPMGAGKWIQAHTEQLKNIGPPEVLICPDNDKPGMKHAESVGQSCLKAGLSVKIVSLPGLRPGEDVSDWLDAGHTVEELLAVAEAAPPFVAPLDDKGSKQTSGSELLFPEPLPWPDRVNGAALLDELTETFKKYVVLPELGAEALAIWTLGAHVHDAFDIFPYLALSSPVKECGKSTCMKILRRLVPRSLANSNITAAALFRTIEKYQPTLLIDEADSFVDMNEDLRGVLNSGHDRELAYTVRTVGNDHEPRTFSTWGPKAIALIGSLPDTVTSRSVVIRLRKKRPDEKVSSLSRNRKNTKAQFEDLKRKCARWKEDNYQGLEHAEPEMLEGLHDRQADNWEPLFAVAEASGGAWPETVRKAARTFCGGETAEEDSERVMLLSDIRDIFGQCKADRLPSKDIVEKLCLMEHRPWPEWDERRGEAIKASGVARLLKDFGIRPKVNRTQGGTSRGYSLEQFKDAFGRYLPSAPLDTPSQSVTPKQDNNINDLEEFKSVTERGRVTVEDPRKPLPVNDCYAVTPQSTPKPDSPCFACQGRDWWFPVLGSQWTCRQCHPPAEGAEGASS